MGSLRVDPADFEGGRTDHACDLHDACAHLHGVLEDVFPTPDLGWGPGAGLTQRASNTGPGNAKINGAHLLDGSAPLHCGLARFNTTSVPPALVGDVF